jgi:tetrahydromethanopterin S-methyltransferase subunit G
MSEEQTDRLEGGTPFEIRVLRELSNLNNRLSSLEEKVDSRLRETRPIWEGVLSRLDGIETRVGGVETRLEGVDARLDGIDKRLDSIDTRLERIDDKFDAVAEELLDMRAEVKRVKKRLPAA